MPSLSFRQYPQTRRSSLLRCLCCCCKSKCLELLCRRIEIQAQACYRPRCTKNHCRRSLRCNRCCRTRKSSQSTAVLKKTRGFRCGWHISLRLLQLWRMTSMNRTDLGLSQQSLHRTSPSSLMMAMNQPAQHGFFHVFSQLSLPTNV